MSGLSLWRSYSGSPGSNRDTGSGSCAAAAYAEIDARANAGGDSGDDQDFRRGAKTPADIGAGDVGLGDGRGGGESVSRGGDADLHFAEHVVGMDPGGGGAAGGVSRYGKRLGAVREGSAGSGSGQKEDHGGSGDGFVIFVLHLDDGFTIHTLFDVVERAFTFDDHDI